MTRCLGYEFCCKSVPKYLRPVSTKSGWQIPIDLMAKERFYIHENKADMLNIIKISEQTNKVSRTDGRTSPKRPKVFNKVTTVFIP